MDGMKETSPLVIENLSYGIREPVFQNASLSLYSGEFISVVVEDASAKANLIDCLYGNLKPTTGTVLFWGIENRGFNRDMIQQRVGWVLSKKETFAPWVTVREYMVGTSRLYRSWNQKLAQRLIEAFGLNIEKRMSVLSPSELTKVKLIRALGFEPEILILDEVMEGLSGADKELAAQAIREMFTMGEMTVLYLCRSPEESLRFTNHVVVLGRNGLTPRVPVAL